MLFPSFGQEKARSLTPVKKLMSVMRETGTRSLDSVDSQLLLRELYDQSFEISQHSEALRPLSVVAMQPKEMIGPYSRRNRVYKRFASLRVGELFNLSIDQFLQHPRDEVELMFQIAEDKSVIEDRNNAAVNKAMAKALEGSDPGNHS